MLSPAGHVPLPIPAIYRFIVQIVRYVDINRLGAVIGLCNSSCLLLP